MAKTVETSVKTGERFKWVQSLIKPVDVAGEYPRGLLGITATATAWSEKRVFLHRFTPIQVLTVGQETVEFSCGADVTIDWIVGELVYMDILFSDGVDLGKILTPTINIRVKEGFTRSATTGLGTGSFGASFGDSFNKGS